ALDVALAPGQDELVGDAGALLVDPRLLAQLLGRERDRPFSARALGLGRRRGRARGRALRGRRSPDTGVADQQEYSGRPAANVCESVHGVLSSPCGWAPRAPAWPPRARAEARRPPRPSGPRRRVPGPPGPLARPPARAACGGSR